jgi:hypothetical protein
MFRIYSTDETQTQKRENAVLGPSVNTIDTDADLLVGSRNRADSDEGVQSKDGMEQDGSKESGEQEEPRSGLGKNKNPKSRKRVRRSSLNLLLMGRNRADSNDGVQSKDGMEQDLKELGGGQEEPRSKVKHRNTKRRSSLTEFSKALAGNLVSLFEVEALDGDMISTATTANHVPSMADYIKSVSGNVEIVGPNGGSETTARRFFCLQAL